MKIYEAKNSLLIFTQFVDESLSIRLLNHIHQGVKVFLFTTDSLENYENNPTWVEAKKYGLFYWNEVPFSEELPESEKAFLDGTVSDRSLYEHISKKTSFNCQQYEIEHVNYSAEELDRMGLARMEWKIPRYQQLKLFESPR